MRRVRQAMSALGLAACSSGDAGSTQAAAGEWAARRGGATLEPAVIAAGLGADPTGARAVSNFVLATALRVSDPGAEGWLRRVALTRVLADELARAAEAQGPVTEQELASWTSAHWLGVDRPPAFRTIHAVVLSDVKSSDANNAQARALAEQIRSAVIDAATPEEFRAKASAVPAGGLTVKVEELEPVAADGRIVRLGAKVGAGIATYEQAFARAASALGQVGETSTVVATTYGYHVLRLIEVIPELRFGAEERRNMAAQDVYNLRARTQLNELTSATIKQDQVNVERSAEEATARVSVD